MTNLLSCDFNDNSKDVYLQKYHVPDFTVEWTARVGSSADEEATALAELNGHIYVAGYQTASGAAGGADQAMQRLLPLAADSFMLHLS